MGETAVRSMETAKLHLSFRVSKRERGISFGRYIMALTGVNASRRTGLGRGNKALRIQGRS